MTITDMPVLLTPEQVAELTGLREQTLMNWRCQHKGPPFVRLGNRTVRYEREAILDWVRERTVRPTAATA